MACVAFSKGWPRPCASGPELLCQIVRPNPEIIGKLDVLVRKRPYRIMLEGIAAGLAMGKDAVFFPGILTVKPSPVCSEQLGKSHAQKTKEATPTEPRDATQERL